MRKATKNDAFHVGDDTKLYMCSCNTMLKWTDFDVDDSGDIKYFSWNCGVKGCHEGSEFRTIDELTNEWYTCEWRGEKCTHYAYVECGPGVKKSPDSPTAYLFCTDCAKDARIQFKEEIEDSEWEAIEATEASQ